MKPPKKLNDKILSPLTCLVRQLQTMRYSVKTQKDYKNAFILFLHHVETKPLLALQPCDITAYLEMLQIKNVSDAYINQIINVLKIYFQYVEERLDIVCNLKIIGAGQEHVFDNS